MRQISPASNLVLACVAAIALVASLELPWYAPPLPPAAADVGGIERTAAQVAHVFAQVGGATTGHAALGGAREFVLALAGAIVTLSLGVAIPPLRAGLREVLRAAALAAPLLVAYLVVVRPGEADGDLHWGALASFAIAGFVASAGYQGSLMRRRRPAPGAWARARP